MNYFKLNQNCYYNFLIPNKNINFNNFKYYQKRELNHLI